MAFLKKFKDLLPQYFVTLTSLLPQLSMAIPLFLVLLISSKGLAQTQKGDSETDGSLATRVVSIPLPNRTHSVKHAADELRYNDELLDSDIATKMAEDGFDLSTLEPAEGKFWQNSYYPLKDASMKNYPQGDVGVHFQGFESTQGLPGTDTIYVRSNENQNINLRLAISRYSQPMMMRAALLRRIGYFLPMPAYYKKLKITFDNEDKKKEFLNNIIEDISDSFLKHLIIEDNVSKHYLIVNCATLEQVSTNNFDVNWGGAPDPQIQGSLIEDFSSKRPYRALLIPYMLVDVSESINRFDTRFVEISSGYINLRYWRGDSFQATSFEDVVWILKRIQKLTAEDIHAIVEQSNYPDSVRPLVLGKLYYRLNDALRSVGLKPTFPQPDLNITSQDGLVAKGRVMQEYIAGYPQRFTHADVPTPLYPGFIKDIAHLVVNSSVLSTALDRLNEKLQTMTAADAYKKFTTKYQQSILDQIRAHPELPIYRKIQGWNGTTQGFNVGANRYLATGTFTGSSAPLQLVDTVSVGANLGRFRALDGLDYLPMAGAQLSLNREYTHVHPIDSIKDALKRKDGEKWTEQYIAPLKVQIKMDHLVDILKSTEMKYKDADGNEQVKKTIDEFLTSLREGEVFTVTTSIGFTVYAQATAGIDTLFGLAPFNFANSLSVESDLSRVTTSQVGFYKVGTGSDAAVHVYIRELKDIQKNASLDANFYLKLMKLKTAKNNSNIKTDAFIIRTGDMNGKMSPEKVEEIKEKLRQCLVPLFKRNETDNFYSIFAKRNFVIKHILEESERKAKFLAWTASNYNEDHKVTIVIPPSETHPEADGKNEVVTLFRSKSGSLIGRDRVTVGLDLFSGYLADRKSKFSLSIPQSGGNPANMLYGSAEWKSINTESDISEKRTQMGSVAMIQHVWAGMRLSKPAFVALLNKIKTMYESPEIESYLISKEQDFLTTQRLDLYRITANVSIFQSGLDKIRDLLLQPGADNANFKNFRARNVLENMMQKIICKNDKLKSKAICSKQVRYASDQQLYRDVLTVFGNGDAKIGYDNYLKICEMEKARKAERYDDFTGVDELKGTEFACLTGWMRRLIQLAYEYPNNKIDQTRWATKVLAIIDENIPTPMLLKFLEKQNYIFVMPISGFRVGDNDADLGYYPNTYGDPETKLQLESASGLVNYWAKETGILSFELDRTLGGAQ